MQLEKKEGQVSKAWPSARRSSLLFLKRNDPPRTRTWNLRLRRPTPYPLGQQAKCIKSGYAPCARKLWGSVGFFKMAQISLSGFWQNSSLENQPPTHPWYRQNMARCTCLRHFMCTLGMAHVAWSVSRNQRRVARLSQ